MYLICTIDELLILALTKFSAYTLVYIVVEYIMEGTKLLMPLIILAALA